MVSIKLKLANLMAIILLISIMLTGCEDKDTMEQAPPMQTQETVKIPKPTKKTMTTYSTQELFAEGALNEMVSDYLGKETGITLDELAEIREVGIYIKGMLTTENSTINEYRGISNLVNLETIYINVGQDTEMDEEIFNELVSLNNLKHLEIQYEGYQEDYKIIKDIYKIVEYNTNIEELGISYWGEINRGDNSALIDLSKLSELDNIKEIVLSLDGDTSIDVGALAELDSLESLTISSDYLQYVENIEKISNLKKIDIHAADMRSLEGINQLAYLEKLILYGNESLEIEQFNHLNGLTNMRSLRIGDTEMNIDIKFIEYMPNLEHFELFGDKIVNSKALENAESIEELRLVIETNKEMVTCIKLLPKLYNLNDLNLHCKEITKVEDLLPLLEIESLKTIDIKYLMMEREDKQEIINQLEEKGVKVLR